jgi:hypothetical protein
MAARHRRARRIRIARRVIAARIERGEACQAPVGYLLALDQIQHALRTRHGMGYAPPQWFPRGHWARGPWHREAV